MIQFVELLALVLYAAYSIFALAELGSKRERNVHIFDVAWPKQILLLPMVAASAGYLLLKLF